jgi:hypothetical protein
MTATDATATTGTPADLDPVTFEVLKNAFATAVDLMSERSCGPATRSSSTPGTSPPRSATQRATQ